MTAVVGVDAGASHSESVAAVASERPTARWRGSPGAIRPGEEAAAVAVWLEAIDHVIPDNRAPAAVVVGAAGTGSHEVRHLAEDLLRQALGTTARIRVTSDGEIAVEAAFPGGGPGIVVTAGSGSHAFGRDTRGAVHRVGGLGWKFGDEGSGYALGRGAVAAVGRALDGRGPRTALAERLSASVAAGAPERLLPWARASAPRDIAALARAVVEIAAAGDSVATGLVNDAAAALAAHVAALLSRLEAAPPIPVALNGGLLVPGSAVRVELLRLLGEAGERVSIVEAPVDPALGALRLAFALL